MAVLARLARLAPVIQQGGEAVFLAEKTLHRLAPCHLSEISLPVRRGSWQSTSHNQQGRSRARVCVCLLLQDPRGRITKVEGRKICFF